jgi:hypothetical protein
MLQIILKISREKNKYVIRTEQKNNKHRKRKEKQFLIAYNFPSYYIDTHANSYFVFKMNTPTPAGLPSYISSSVALFSGMFIPT